MRISLFPPGILPAVAVLRPQDLRVEAATRLSDRYPNAPPSTWPAVERVFEGVVVPRAARGDTLLTDERARVLSAQTWQRIEPEPPAPDLNLTPAPVLFYRLHSSTAALATDPAGRHVDLFA